LLQYLPARIVSNIIATGETALHPPFQEPSTMRSVLPGLARLAGAAAHQLDLEDASDPRLFCANYTSSLVSVNSTLLAYALLALALGGAAALALYYLYLESASQSSSSYGSYGSYGNDSGYSYYQAR
jgi:hypothetical protein